MKALNDNPDKVDSYFSGRLQVLLKHVMPNLGTLYWIIRFEVQARGTIHAHLLIGVKGCFSKHDLEKARTKNDAYQKCTDDEKREIDECRDNVLTCSCANLGISTMHPRPDPANWPGPYGQDVHTPADNILRQRFLDVSHNPDELQERYEKLVNRVMLHHCRDGYCLEKNSKGEKVCRFKFPMKLIGFEAVVSDDGKTLLRPRRLPDVAADGAIYVDGKLCYLRNHPTIVHHIPELLTIWGANIEGRTIETYEQVLRYLLKYMYKVEPDNQTFQAISKAVVSNAGDDMPVRKVFHQILMKTLKQHGLSKQECARILNGRPFVQSSKEYVNVNVMGTRKVTIPTGTEAVDANMLQDNVASVYWNRDTDSNYQVAVESFREGQASEDPATVSLFKFASKYTTRWKLRGEERVPHVTPNFRQIPNKHVSKMHDRYVLYLKTLLLVYKAGTKLSDYTKLGKDDLELEVKAFVQISQCPRLILEEFQDSQIFQESENVLEREIDSDVCDDDLHIEPIIPQETYPQEPWMDLLCPIHTEGDATILDFEDTEHDFSDVYLQLEAENVNGQQFHSHRKYSALEIKAMKGWLHEAKNTESLPTARGDDEGGLPEQLNVKQLLAFNLLRHQIQKVLEQGIDKAPQLLLNISGAAGTGKSFWLNCLRRYVKEHGLPSSFVKSDAPSGMAAFQIGGQTLHAMLQLPIGNHDLEPLEKDSPCQGKLQDAFSKTAILVIDEKSMIGQKTFFHVSERLKEAKPHRASEPFGGLTVVLLGDWKQLPPVFNSPLYHNPCGSKSRTKAGAAGCNVYRLFKDVIFFNQIERQAGEDQSLFRNELCRLSEGTFSEQDWQRWKKRDLHLLSREKQKLFLEKAVLAFAYKKDMVRHNIEKVKANNQPIALIKAESKPKGEANKTSAERDSGLTSVIALSKDTVFRLSCNLWTEAGLTNGAVGNVYDIVYAPNTKPPELPVAVIGIFDDYCGPSFLPDVPKSVPIFPVQRTWISNKIHCSRTMLPIILGYALSIHKLQGSTLDKVILNAGLKEFALGLLFVGASRVKRFEDLTFEPFPNFERFPQIAKCTSLEERLQEEERMKKQEENTITLLQVPLEDAQQAAKVHAESINQPQEYPAKSSSMPVDVQCACAMDEIEEMEVIEDITSTPEVLELSVDQPCQDLTPSLIVLKGIDNLGNTCYMNCILQCLFHVNTVSEYFCNQESFSDGIAKQFAILLSNPSPSSPRASRPEVRASKSCEDRVSVVKSGTLPSSSSSLTTTLIIHLPHHHHHHHPAHVTLRRSHTHHHFPQSSLPNSSSSSSSSKKPRPVSSSELSVPYLQSPPTPTELQPILVLRSSRDFPEPSPTMTSQTSGLKEGDDFYYKSNITPRSNNVQRASAMLGGGGLLGGVGSYKRGMEIPSAHIPAYSSMSSGRVSDVKTTREREKQDMRDLNERFANYIEKVRFLEAQNRKLASELDDLRSKWGKETNAVKVMYETELKEARDVIEDTNKEKSKVEVRLQSLQEEVHELMKQ
ncbi:hypothetical protein ACOMHN_043224 [Nucella lapillus]